MELMLSDLEILERRYQKTIRLLSMIKLALEVAVIEKALKVLKKENQLELWIYPMMKRISLNLLTF